jgi:hypothetical protein
MLGFVEKRCPVSRSHRIMLVNIRVQGIEAAREAGIEIAASAIAVVDRAAEAAGALPAGLTPRSRLQQHKPGSPIPGAATSVQRVGGGSVQPRSPGPTAIPALVPAPGCAVTTHSTQPGTSGAQGPGHLQQGARGDMSPSRPNPALSVVLPPEPSDEDGDNAQPQQQGLSPGPATSPQRVLGQGLLQGGQQLGGGSSTPPGTGADLAAYLGVGALPWEPHASCLSVGPLKDRLWLEATRVGQQRHQMQVGWRDAWLASHGSSDTASLCAVCTLLFAKVLVIAGHQCVYSHLHVCLQVVLDVMQGSQGVFAPLPPVELTGALPGLTDSLHLVGCCNARCVQRVPGLPERSVGLRKCAACKRVAWCSDACREAANAEGGQHHSFCHWACLLLEL